MNKSQFKLFLKFLKFLLPYRKKQLIILFLTGLGVILSLLNPFLSKLIVDKAIMNKELKTFIVLGFLGAGIFILNGLVNAIASFLEKSIQLKLRFDLNKKLFSHLQQLPLDFFKNKSTAEHMFNIDYDIERVVDFINSVPREIVNIFPKLFFILIIIFFLNWQMALFSLILVPVFYFPVLGLTRRMRRVFEELVNNSQGIFKRLEEIFSHIYLIKAFGKESSVTRSYLRALIANMRLRVKNIRLEIINNFSAGSFNRVLIGLITLFGGFLVIKGKTTVGTLTAIMIYLAELMNLEGNFIFFFQRINFGLVSCGRLEKILEEKQKNLRVTPAKIKIFQEPDIQFKNVSFGYKADNYILKNIDFSMDKRLLALVGPSGCGKTTLLNMLLGLYQPWAGEILIEGNNINDLELCSLTKQIGVALQESFLWNDTVENNIKYAHDDALKDEMLKFSRMTGIDEFVNDLPQGYDTVIGERGAKLSEGQKQRIALARALIKNPKILILDEAMSSLDSLSEEKIITQITKMPDINKIIIVSHRLSTVAGCELVYFLKTPETIIIDQSQRLLEKDKDFYNLFAAQIR